MLIVKSISVGQVHKWPDNPRIELDTPFPADLQPYMPREEFTGRIKAVNRVLREDGKRCCRCTKFCVLLQYAIISLIVVVAAGFAIYGFVNLDTHDNSPAVFLGGALIISFTVSVVMIVKNIVKARKMERTQKNLDALIEKFNIADAGSLNWRLYEWKELSHFDIEGQNDGRGRNNRRGRQVPEQVRAVPRYVHFSTLIVDILRQQNGQSGSTVPPPGYHPK